MLRKLLIFTAAAEGGFGLLLVVAPVLIARLLLGTEVSGIAITVGRLVGVGLIALGVGCWPRGDLRIARNVMLTYSTLAMAGLIIVGLRGRVGVLLWPAVVVHAAIAALLLVGAKR